MHISTRNVEVPMLDREGVRAAGEGDNVEFFVERQFCVLIAVGDSVRALGQEPRVPA